MAKKYINSNDVYRRWKWTKMLCNIIVDKAEKNLVAINPNRTNIREPYTSRRNKYKTNLKNNM